MKIEKNQIDDLNAEVTLIIEKDDYLANFNKELKSYQQKSQLKGFRKGKTPISVIKKMYGESVMQQSVMQLLSEKMDELVNSEDMKIIGDPFLVGQDNLPHIDYKNPTDYSYKFEIGLEPEFDVLGVSKSDKYERKVVNISEQMIDEEVESMLKRLGTQSSVDEPIQADDIIYFSAIEIENGNEKEGGHSCTFSSSYNSLSEEYQSQVLGKSKGLKFDADIYDLEKEMPTESVDKYLLGIDPEDDSIVIGADYRLEITDVVRMKKAELDQTTFDKGFGEGNVTSEEEAREKIKGYLSDYFDKESTNVLNREIMEVLMSVNSIHLPETHLLRWVNQNREQPITDKEGEDFLQEMKWMLVKKKLSKSYDVKVTEEEIINYFIRMIQQYSPGITGDMLKSTAMSLLDNKEQVDRASEQIHAEKLFVEVRKDVTIDEKPIDKDEFYEMIKSLNDSSK